MGVDSITWQSLTESHDGGKGPHSPWAMLLNMISLLYYTILYCATVNYTILYYTILYYTILYYTILYYTILYYTILCYAMLCYTILYYTILYYTILYYTILYYTILYYTILYYTILYYTILYYTILYYTILYYTILYYTILYYTILYYTILYYAVPPPPCLGAALRKNCPLVPQSNSRNTFFNHRIAFFMVLVDAGRLFRCAGQHFMRIAWFAAFGRLYLLLYHLFHSLLCTIHVPMYHCR